MGDELLINVLDRDISGFFLSEFSYGIKHPRVFPDPSGLVLFAISISN
jgi:hypothetical protein